MALTYKQRRFCAEYLRDQNGTAAAIRSGYSAKGAHVTGSQLLSNPNIKENIEGRIHRVENTSEVELSTVLVELKRILLADPANALDSEGRVLPLRDWPLDLRRALAGVEVEEIWAGRGEARAQIGEIKKVKYWSKTHAAEQLLRTLGAFHDRIEVRASLESLLEAATKPPSEPTVAQSSPSEGQDGGSAEIVAPGASLCEPEALSQLPVPPIGVGTGGTGGQTPVPGTSRGQVGDRRDK